MSKEDGAGRFVGYNFIKRKVEGGVKMEIWQDDPNEKDPKSHWKLVKLVHEAEDADE